MIQPDDQVKCVKGHKFLWRELRYIPRRKDSGTSEATCPFCTSKTFQKVKVKQVPKACRSEIVGSSSDMFDRAECGEPAKWVTQLGLPLCTKHAKQKRWAKAYPVPITKPRFTHAFDDYGGGVEQ